MVLHWLQVVSLKGNYMTTTQRYNPLEQIADCRTLEQCFDRLRGQDLITAAHACKKKFGIDDYTVYKAFDKWAEQPVAKEAV